MKTYSKKHLANLYTKYLFPETLPDYFQKNNKYFFYLIFEYWKFPKMFR